MYNKLATTSIVAPGFMGLNTQDSSVALESGFATQAMNCVIDKFGRIGARKGWLPEHTTNADLGSNPVQALGELITTNGTSYILAAGNNKLYRLNGSTLTTLTYGGGGSAPTITANNWQLAPLNGIMFFYQEGHDPLYYDPGTSTTTYKRISEHPSYVATVQQSNIAISAFGRTWTASTTSDKNTIQFSDLLEGYRLSTGSAGTLDVSQVWPNGVDEIQALASHNGFLIVFGKTQILIYQNPQDPAALSLQDAITGVGCVARDSVVATGNDVIFLSDSGVRSLRRVIQEKSAPLRDLSANVRDDLVEDVFRGSTTSIRAAYSDKEAFYLLSIPSQSLVYCFDMRAMMQNGAARVTQWNNLVPQAFCYKRDKTLLLGVAGYVAEYTGHLDNTSTYPFFYYTSYFDFQSPTTVKYLKKIGFYFVGGQNYTVSVKYGFDYSDIYNSQQITLPMFTGAEYNIAEFNIGEYGGSAGFNVEKINVGGSGNVLQVGFETNINGNALSIQKLDVYVKTGKIK